MKKKVKFIGVLLASMLLVTGCNSKDTANTTTTKSENAEKKYTIGVTQIVAHPALDSATKGFKQALADSKVNVTYNMQNAQGDPSNSQTIATNFVGDKVDLIFANSTPSALSSLNATKEIPIIFTSVTDPVATKLISSMDKPGGNVTGTADTHPDAIPNTLEFINKYMKGKRVGMIFNSGEQNSTIQVATAKKVAAEKNMQIVEATVATSAEVKTAAESLIGKVDVFYVITDNTVASAVESVVKVSQEQHIPLFVGEFDLLKRGGFAAYSFDYYTIGYEAGEMAVQILKDGKKPADIPSHYPTKLKLMINKDAAKEMGIEINSEWDKIAEYIK